MATVVAMRNYSGRAIAVMPDAARIPVIVTITDDSRGLLASARAVLHAAPGEDETPLLNVDELTLVLPDETEQKFLVVNRQGGAGPLRLELTSTG